MTPIAYYATAFISMRSECSMRVEGQSMVRTPPRNTTSPQRDHEANIPKLLQIMQLHILQHISFFQSLIDSAGIRNLDERPPRIEPVIDPILVPSGRRADEFLGKRSAVR